MNPINPIVGQRPAKIQNHHLERLAVVYVRQSSLQQVEQHRESAAVQTNLRQRAVAWGWPNQRILVLDGDQGRSGTTTDGRDDFARLLTEIAMSHVGLVLGFQINRLAREDEACCRLIKTCAVFDTLLADQDGLYHPDDFNDRLILTIKGFMGGFELHQLQQRMQAGRLNRARRGEWLGQTPPGYVVGPDGKLQFDPDQQVQEVVRLVLDQFAHLGSVSGLLRYLRQHRIQLPFRSVGGTQRGQLIWRPPHRETLRLLLRRPVYAGVYTWGRQAVDPKRPRTLVQRELENAPIFLRDNHPAYISWEQHQSNIQRLRQHRSRGPRPGPARTKTAVLAGLVVCGHCNCRMQTRYTRTLRYDCQRRALDYADTACQSLVGEPLEQLVNTQILEVVTPASLELSRHAAEQTERERGVLDQQWRLRLERASQDADRVRRQYHAVEPENRLVARTLERQWEEALLTQRSLQEEYDRFRQTQPASLSEADRTQIEHLANHLPKIWQSPLTSVEDKRQVVRLLLHKAVVWTTASTDQVKLELHWLGGVTTEHHLRRPVSSWNRVADLPETLECMRRWRTAGWTSRRIAEELNATGQRTPQGKPFTAPSVRQLLKRKSGKASTKADRSKTRQRRKRRQSA